MFAARSMITKNDYAERAAIEEQLFVESPDGMAFLLLLLISHDHCICTWPAWWGLPLTASPLVLVMHEKMQFLLSDKSPVIPSVDMRKQWESGG